MADSDRWNEINQGAKGAGGVLHITWLRPPTDPQLKARAERALFNGAKAAGYAGVVRIEVDGEAIRVCQLEDGDGNARPRDAAEGWLGVAGIPTKGEP